MADVSFERSEELAETGRDIIAKHHSHLVEANIIYLLRYGTWKVNRKVKYGSAEKTPGKYKSLTGADFVVTINSDAWNGLPLSARQALVDHELCHCGRGDDDDLGNPTWHIEPHTVEDFAAIIRRHGLWANDLKKFESALQAHREHQIEMFGDDNGLKLVSGN